MTTHWEAVLILKLFQGHRGARQDDHDGEEQPDAVAPDVLDRGDADLGPDGSPDEHQDGGDDLHPPLDAVGEAAVSPGEQNGEQVSAHRDGRGAADQVDQGRHADEAAAHPEKAGQPAGEQEDDR